MTDKTDAQIAREWARRAVESAENAQPVSRGALAAARHILATTTPPTMVDVEWVDEVHSGLCAEHPVYGIVRMLSKVESLIDCILVDGRGFIATADKLTPIHGTRLDLTPRREPEAESTPAHPTVLSTVDDYDSAPEGTIAADDDGAAVKDVDGRWRWTGSELSYRSDDLCYGESDPMTVVRWGK